MRKMQAAVQEGADDEAGLLPHVKPIIALAKKMLELQTIGAIDMANHNRHRINGRYKVMSSKLLYDVRAEKRVAIKMIKGERCIHAFCTNCGKYWWMPYSKRYCPRGHYYSVTLFGI